jgi:hypothetical protein
MKFTDPYSIDAINYAIEVACVRSESVQLRDDIQQAVWLAMLEKRDHLHCVRAAGHITANELALCLALADLDINARVAYESARHMCRDWWRGDAAKTIPISQTSTPLTNDESDDSDDGLPPWDRADLTAQGAMEPMFEDILYTARRAAMADVMATVSQADRRFMTRYVKKLSGHTPAQHQRFHRLKMKLKKEGHDLTAIMSEK